MKELLERMKKTGSSDVSVSEVRFKGGGCTGQNTKCDPPRCNCPRGS